MLLDIELRDDIENMKKTLIDTRIPIFLNKYSAFKKQNCFESKRNGNKEEIYTKYKIDLASLIPDLKSFTTAQKATLNHKSNFQN